MNPIGVMQGRLLPKYKGRYQAHPVNTWHKEFEIAEKLNLQLIEFIFDYDGFEKNPLFSSKGLNLISKLIKKHKVDVKTVCADFYMESPFFLEKLSILKKNMKVLKKLIINCSKLGISDIIIPCVDKSSLRKEQDLKVFIKNFSYMIEDAEKYNINLSLETDLEPLKFIHLINEFKSEKIKINYDIGNSAALGYDYKLELKTFANKISDIHIKDRMLNGKSVELGKGNANFREFFIFLKKCSYNGPLIMQAYRDDEGLKIFKKQLSWIKNIINKYYEC